MKHKKSNLEITLEEIKRGEVTTYSSDQFHQMLRNDLKNATD